MQSNKEKQTIRYHDYRYKVYVRVSTDRDSQKDSVSNQVDICRYWLEQNGFEWNDETILKDEGRSGTLFLERSAMQLILKKARKREIQMVVFKSIHRLARDLKDALEIKEVLLGHGVRVVTLEEGYDSLYEGKSDMKFEMYAMFAAQYPKSLSVSISAALAAKVRRGEHIGKVPYGYNRVDHKLVINEEEAPVIKQIFTWYNEGIGFKRITHMLNKCVEEGTFPPPHTRKTWQITSIQRIIGNPIFCGRFVLNQYTSIKVDGRKKQIRNPKEKWNVFENQHPAIISVDDWEKANSKPTKGKKKITPWNEFRGLMKCGKCGSNMVILQSMNKRKDGSISRWKYLKCSAYRRAGINGCVNHVPIRYEQFRAFIVGRLMLKGEQVALDYDYLFGNNKKQQQKRLKNSIEEYEDKKNRLVDLYVEELINKIEFENKRNEFEELIQKAQDQLRVLNEEESQEIAIRDIKQAFESIKKKDQDIFHALNVLIDHITVHPDGTTDIHYKFE